MVEKREIVTIFEIIPLGDDFEQIRPVKVVEGVYDEKDYSFIGNDGVIYEHIEDTDYPNYGFANRIIVDCKIDVPNDSIDSIEYKKKKKFNSDSRLKYMRYVQDKEDIYQKGDFAQSLLIDKDSRKYNETAEEVVTVKKKKLIQIEMTPKQMAEAVKKSIKGQDEAIKKIVTCIWASYNFRNLTKKQMLLVGATGVGKTAIFEKLSKILNVPVVIFSVPGLSQAGYVGRSTDEILKQIYFECNEDLDLAEQAIVILDEIDKIAFNREITSADVSTVGVQNELLKMIEGYTRVVEINEGMDSFTMDTSNIIFVASGAFQEMFEKPKPSIGFNSQPKKNVSEKVKMTTEALVNYGLKRELIGRLPIIVEMNNMTKEILREIILESEDSELLAHVDFLKENGITVSNLDNIIDMIVNDAMSHNVGARGLVETISNLLLDVIYVIGNNPGRYNELIIGSNILEDPSDFELIEVSSKKRVRVKE